MIIIQEEGVWQSINWYSTQQGCTCVFLYIDCVLYREMWQEVLLSGTLDHLKTAIFGARRMAQWTKPVGGLWFRSLYRIQAFVVVHL